MKQFLLLFSLFIYSSFTFGQTPISLPATPPYLQDFNTTPGATGTAYPSGWASYNSSPDVIDNTMVVGNASSGTGTNYNYGSRIGLLGSGSNFDPGYIILAIDNTVGRSGLQISYDVIKIREQARNCTFNLEYSTTSAIAEFSTVFGGTYNSGTLSEGTITNYSNIDISALDNTSGTIYLRWYYSSSGGGSRDGIALDNVNINWNVATPNIDLLFQDAGDENMARGSNDNVIFSTQAIVTTALTTLNQVTLRTNGNYSNTDIAANGFKLWFSTDGSFGGDTQLAATGSTTGNGETITFSSLSQTIPMNSIRYFFVTADIAPAATLNNTLGIANTTTADFTFAASNTKTGAAASGELHTIVGLNTGTVTTSLCVSATQGEPINIPFTYSPTGLYTGTFSAELSDATGSFAFPTSIGSVASNNSGSQFISATIPANTPQGSAYRVRVISSVPNLEGADNGADITIDLLSVSIAPITTQNLTEFQNGDAITATESHPIQSRRWKYSTVSGSGYNNFLGSDITQTPYFETDGTYYLVVETLFACGKSVISNEVQINVANFVGTLLFPGDLVIIGWDGNIGGGVDEFVLTNLVPLTQGTKFQVVNATYENGSAANVRSNTWQNTAIMQFTYKLATDLAIGSRISFELPATGGTGAATNIRINGATVPTTTLEGVRITGTSFNGVNISGSAPDQMFITQGRFTGTDFDGYVLFGMTNDANWVEFTNTVSTARTSRRHPNIKCLNTSHPTGLVGSYYNTTALHNGTQREILSSITNMSNWITLPTTNTNDIPAAVLTTNFNVTASLKTEIEWIGGSSGTNDDNWFNCQNWENLYVPNKRQDVIMTTSAVDGSRINDNADYSDEYLDLAEVKNLTLEEQRLAVFDARSAKLSIYENLLIKNNGFLDMQDGVNFVLDGTINIRGNWTNERGTIGFQEGQSLIVFEGGSDQTITSVEPESFYDVKVNCGVDLTINNEIIITTFVDGADIDGGNIEFTSGNIIGNTANPVTFTREASYTGESATRHIRGAARLRTNKTDDFVFPIGKNGVYRPLTIHPQSGGAITQFFAEYFFEIYTDIQPVIAPLDHVSQIEYWIVNRESGTSDAQLTLSWGIESKVGNLGSLVVSHWTAANQWESRGNSLTTGGITAGTVKSNDIITQFSPFTLGSVGGFNPLPLTWLSFDAKYDESQKNILLEWATLSESQNQFFAIERSENGIDFEEIGITTGALNSSSVRNYQFWDFEPISAKVYYRIKQVDTNGEFSYSNIKMIEVKETRRLGITNYQNQNILYANLEEATKAKIQVYDMSGAIVGTFDISLKEGKNEVVLSLNLSKAVYVYKIELENQADFVSGKFLVK